LDRAELVAFVPAADLGRARQFYETVLGLPCVDATGIRATPSPSPNRSAGSLAGVLYGERPWRMRTARAALTTGLALGFHDALEPKDPPPVVTPERKERPVRDRIVLYFHPQVPEATLVLIRSG
jgi:catechol 2,3-dioxygenase-like lactoylglutathione lyase family enzyme